jgi:hypothetical protein
MATSTRQIFQPRIPQTSIPIAFGVTVGAEASPPVPPNGSRDGDIYIGGQDIWITKSGIWAKWKPEESMRLVIDQEPLYVAPCATQGIQLVDSTKEHRLQVIATRTTLNIGEPDDMLCVLKKKLTDVLESATKYIYTISRSANMKESV